MSHCAFFTITVPSLNFYLCSTQSSVTLLLKYIRYIITFGPYLLLHTPFCSKTKDLLTVGYNSSIFMAHVWIHNSLVIRHCLFISHLEYVCTVTAWTFSHYRYDCPLYTPCSDNADYNGLAMYCLEDGRIPNDILYDELPSGWTPVIHSFATRMSVREMSQHSALSFGRTLSEHLKTREADECSGRKAALRKKCSSSNRPKTTYKCDLCAETATRIGLYRHMHRCSSQENQTN